MQQPLVYNHTLPDVQWTGLSGGSPDGGLAVYRIQVEEFTARLVDLQALLQPDEVVRANRYHQEADRHRFIVARGVLRIILGQYTNQLPTDIRFAVGTNKKPELAGGPAIQYNVSHSGGWIVIAIGPKPVGADIEQVVADFRFQDVLTYSFSLEERQHVAESVVSRLNFYQLWTRKEALTKAIAKGIDDDFHRIPALDGTHQLPDDLGLTTDQWIVSTFMLTDGYVASVAWPGIIYSSNIGFCHVDRSLLDTLTASIVP